MSKIPQGVSHTFLTTNIPSELCRQHVHSTHNFANSTSSMKIKEDNIKMNVKKLDHKKRGVLHLLRLKLRFSSVEYLGSNNRQLVLNYV
jgi:hypothetical protein